jgi:prepilin-type N-terminal cleavage/methylation domain-containing protein
MQCWLSFVNDEENLMRKQKGFSLIELLIVVAIILIIAAIAIPNLLRARMSANDSGAASTMRTLNTAQVSYTTSYPLDGFSVSMAMLGPGAAPGVDCTTSANVKSTSACLIDGNIGCSDTGPCPKSGYAYYLAPGTPAAGTTVVPDYTFSAGPLGWYTTGTKNWCSTADAVVRNAGVPQGVTTTIAAAVTGPACDVAPYVPSQ